MNAAAILGLLGDLYVQVQAQQQEIKELREQLLEASRRADDAGGDGGR